MTTTQESNVMDSLHRLMRLTRRYQGGGRHRSSYGETRLMRMLLDNSDLSASELAEALDIRPPSLTKVLDGLEHRGEIVRARDDKDSRIWRINLTEQGRTELEKRLTESDRVSQAIENTLSEEESRVFCELCEKLSIGLAELSESEEIGESRRGSGRGGGRGSGRGTGRGNGRGSGGRDGR